MRGVGVGVGEVGRGEEGLVCWWWKLRRCGVAAVSGVGMAVRNAAAVLLLAQGCLGDLYLHVSVRWRGMAAAAQLQAIHPRCVDLADAARDKQPRERAEHEPE